MKSKIINLFFITIISFLGVVGFYSTVLAATIFTDDFNSYIDGRIGGQGGWTGVTDFTIVQGTTVFEGAKAVKISEPFPGSHGIEKSGNLTNDGRVTIYVRGIIGGTTHPEFEIQLKEVNNVVLSVKATAGFGFRYYKADIGRYASFGPVMQSHTWYAIQIDWRSFDHKARYRINNEAFTDWQEGLTEWSGGLDTVRISLSDGIGFVDAIQENLVGHKNPVLIVPGIIGTELWNGDEYIWVNLGKMAGDIGDQFLTENLSLNESGNSIKDILAKSVIERILRVPLFSVNIFEGLRLDLESKGGYSLNENLFFFPYDWRFDLDNTKDLLKQKISDIKLQTGSNKVDVIAHSMGGLLTKSYIEEYGKDSINKLIFVGTPHLGAPKAGKVLLNGDNFSIIWLDPDRIKELAVNMPSIHELLPNQTYFNQFQGYIKPFNIFGNPSFYNYEDTKKFFINDKNKNPLMFEKAEDFFGNNLDNLDLSGLDAYNIAGCKSATQVSYRLNILGNIGSIRYDSGDGTVPINSSDYLNISESQKYYVKNGDHSQLPSTNGVRELILNILSQQNTELLSNISNNKNFCAFKGKLLTWRSPVEVHIYDQPGSHTGPLKEENGIEYGISDVDYEIIDSEKFIFLPTDEGQEYEVRGIGEKEGTFDLLISEIEDRGNSKTIVYNDIPVTLNSKINFNISESSNDEAIQYDFENSGQFSEMQVSAILDGIQSEDLTPPQTQAELSSQSGSNSWFVSDVTLSLNATDDNSGVLTTKYSLDNGNTFNDYLEPIQISTEGITTIKYYSVDKAGNNEDIKSLELKIDKLSPEISVVYDINKDGFVFSAIDNIDSDPIINCTANSCLAVDEAGNRTAVTFDLVDRKVNNRLILKSITYNDNQPILPSENSFHVEFKEKRGSLLDFDQFVKIKKQEKIRINYQKKKNQSIVTSRLFGKKTIKTTYPGLKFLQLITERGNIKIEIE